MALPGPRFIQVRQLPITFPVSHQIIADNPWPSSYFGIVQVHRRTVPIEDESQDYEILEFDHYGIPRSKTLYAKRREQWGCLPPTLFSVCQESRNMASKLVTRCLAITPDPSIVFREWEDFPSEETLGAGRKIPNTELATAGILFQPERDTIYIPRLEEMVFLPGGLLKSELSTKNIQSLAIPIPLFDPDVEIFIRRLFRALGKWGCQHLVELFLIVSDLSIQSARDRDALGKAEGRKATREAILQKPPTDCSRDFHLLTTFEIMTPEEFEGLPRWDDDFEFKLWEQEQLAQRKCMASEKAQ